MKRTCLTAAGIELVAVTIVATFIPVAGMFLLAPLAALSIGSLAGWCAARNAAAGPNGKGGYAGAIAGIGALAGTTVGVAILGMLVSGDPVASTQAAGPLSGSGVPASSIAVLLTATGGITGLFVGCFNLVLSAFGGLIAGLMVGAGHGADVQRKPVR